MTARFSQGMICVLVVGAALIGTAERTNGSSFSPPDTLDLRRFVPLEEGNTWEYGLRNDRYQIGFRAYTVFEVLGDTLVGETEYFRVSTVLYDGALDASSRSVHLVRYDSSGVVVTLNQGEEAPLFIAALRSNPAPNFYYEREEVTIIADTTLEIRSEAVDVSIFRSTLYAGGYSNHDYRQHASEIGLLYHATCPLQCSGDAPDTHTLLYAAVGGTTYGRSMVATKTRGPGHIEDQPARLSAYPNPSAGIVHLEFALPSAQKTSIRVFNVLGRQVVTSGERFLPSGTTFHKIDLSHLPPGTYFVQSEGAGRNEAWTRVVLRP